METTGSAPSVARANPARAWRSLRNRIDGAPSDLVLTVIGAAAAFAAWVLMVTSGRTVSATVFADPLFAVAYGLVGLSAVLLTFIAFKRFGLPVASVIFLGILHNLVFTFATHWAHVPVYFAIIGSLFAGFCAGPVVGMVVGALSTLVAALIYPELLAMAPLVMIPGAIILFLFVGGYLATVARVAATGLAMGVVGTFIMVVNRLTVVGEVQHNGARNLNNFFLIILDDPVQALITQTAITQFLDKLLLFFLGYAAAQVSLQVPAFRRFYLTEPVITLSSQMSNPGK